MAIYKSKTPTKDGRSYFFRIKYKDIFGETHDYSSPKFKLKSEAKEAQTLFEIELNDKKKSMNNITIKIGYQELRSSKLKKVKKQTVLKDDSLYRYLKPIEDEKINDFNVLKYNRYLQYIEQQKLSIDFKNKILGLLKQIINHSHRLHNTNNTLIGYIERFKDTEYSEKEMLFFTYDEYIKFDSVIDDLKYHTLFEMLYYMGIRQGELQALKWKDIDFVTNTLKIDKTLTTKIKGEQYTISTPKTKKSIRTLPLTNKLINDLKLMLEEAKKYRDFSYNWFVFGNTLPTPENTIQKRKNNYCKKAEVKQIRIHDFRHSCASLLINQGASIVLVSKYLGHANVSMTLDKYTHMYKSELENITNLLNNL